MLAEIFQVTDGSWIRNTWFEQSLQLCFTATLTGDYRPFDALTDDALQMVALRRGGTVSGSDRARLKEAQAAVPPFTDVRASLAALGDAGFIVAALTNSTGKSANATLTHASLTKNFSNILSVDAVKCYQPARQAYAYAAHELDVPLKHICLVAAHAWDISGAMAAGAPTPRRESESRLRD